MQLKVEGNEETTPSQQVAKTTPLITTDHGDYGHVLSEEGTVVGAQEIKFDQHDDPDVIIPDRISWYLVVSAQLLLVNAIVAYVYALNIIGTLLVFVWFTSILHWRKPRFSSYRRFLDYTAVISLVGYSTYYSITLPATYTTIWFVGIACIGMLFAANETAYYLQIGKTPLGDDDGRGNYMLPYAAPNTNERDWVFKRTTYVHLFAVHVAANALALAIILGSQA